MGTLTVEAEVCGADPGLAGHAVYAEGLVRHFNGVRAVDGVELRIPPSEIYGFLGPNGAGKVKPCWWGPAGVPYCRLLAWWWVFSD